MNTTSLKQEKQLSLQDYLEIAWRRKWWLIIPVLISAAVAIFLLSYLPKTYRSSTLILVEAQKVPEDYVKSAVSGTIEDRLATIRQQILSRSLLQKIIDEFGLYKKESGKVVDEELLDSMRKSIEIKTDGTRKTVDAFTISFEGQDPKTVMGVTNKLASLYIEENLKVREQLVEGTTDFLEKELLPLKASLDQQEKLISEQKRKYMGALPQQLDANLRSLDRYQMELQTISTSLQVAEDKKNALEEKMKANPMMTDETKTSGTPQGSGLDNYESLAQMKNTLEVLRREYTDAYPDIINLKRKIKGVEETLSLNQAKIAGQEKVQPAEKRNEPVLPPAMDDHFEFSTRFQQISTEIRALKERQAVVTKNIRQLEKDVEQTPLREQEMEVLSRDYENTKKAYQTLLDKKLNAELSGNLEKRQKGEQFRILDYANLPDKPFKPDRNRLIGLCLGSGLGVGLGMVLLMEFLNTSFKKPEEIEQELGLNVLVGVPLLNIEKKGKKQLLSKESGDRPESVIR
ncbi:MAG: GumC family protein [Nitrospiria bacterium]